MGPTSHLLLGSSIHCISSRCPLCAGMLQSQAVHSNLLLVLLIPTNCLAAQGNCVSICLPAFLPACLPVLPAGLSCHVSVFYMCVACTCKSLVCVTVCLRRHMPTRLPQACSDPWHALILCNAPCSTHVASVVQMTHLLLHQGGVASIMNESQVRRQ